jgi:photosystem II stability/assembly factor-like uncharacterized protein
LAGMLCNWVERCLMISFPKVLSIGLLLLPLAALAQIDPDDDERFQAGGERNLTKEKEHEKYMLPAVVGMAARARLESWQKRLQLIQESPFNSIKWRNVGPETQGGRVINIAAPVSDPHKVFVAFATGGLWVTEDEGITWKSLFDNQSSYAIGHFALSKDGKTIWVGTGENNSQRTSYSGTGVFKSTDGGSTWKNMGLEDTHRIGKILINPKDENTVYVGAIGALYSQNPNRGVYKTTDGGKTWQWVLKLNEYTGVIDLAMDPRNPDVIYAAAWERDRRAWNFLEGGKGSAIYKTVDGGKTWKKMMSGLPDKGQLGRIGLAIAPSKPDTVYAWVDNQAVDEDPEVDERQPGGELTIKRFLRIDEKIFAEIDHDALDRFFRRYMPTDVKLDETLDKVRKGELKMADLKALMLKRDPNIFMFGTVDQELYRSDDGGKSWRKTHQHRLGDHLGYYCGRVWVNPIDSEEVVTTGVISLRSKDGGRTFQEIAETNHSDHHAFWYDPTNPNRQFEGNDGGLYISGDAGGHWRHINNLAVGQFTSLALDNKTPYNIYGGLQDNGTMKGTASVGGFRRGPGWTTVGGGDGSAVAVDQRPDGDFLFTASQFGAHSGQNQKTGERWGARAAGTGLRYNWVSPIIISSHHPDVVYLGSNKVHRSFNNGRAWTDISGDITKNLPNGDVPYSTIKDLSESPLQFGLIYAGCDDGAVKMTPDGGYQWIDISTPQPKKWVSRIVASKWDKGTVYCSQSGYREDDFNAYLWKSTDFGKTWRSIVGNLPAETINVIREDPNHDNILYVGTDLGVYVSFDRGDKWEALAGGLMTTPVHDLQVQGRDNELVIATHARSVWVLPLQYVYDLTPDTRSQDLKIWPLSDMRRNRNWGYQYGDTWSTDDVGAPNLKITFWTKTAGKATIRLKDKDGKVVKEAAVDANTGYNFADLSLQLSKGKLYTTPTTKPKTGAEAVKDPFEADRAKYVEAGDYTVEISINGKTSTASWKLTN